MTPTPEQIAQAADLLWHFQAFARGRPMHEEVLTHWREKAVALLAAADWPADHALHTLSARTDTLLAHTKEWYGNPKAPTLESIELGNPRHVPLSGERRGP